MDHTVETSAATLKPASNRRLLRHAGIALLLAVVAYAVCALVIQAVGNRPAGDPAKRTKQVMQLLEPVQA